MHIHCPHCHNPIELVDDYSTLCDAKCPSCGSNLSFVDNESIAAATLADWIEEKPLTPHEAAEICAKIANSLQHIHQAGVIHRDLKPSNILLDSEGEPHIMDFGLSKRERVEGRVIGTPAYMPPEQVYAKETDERSDVYSLGVILFELLTGKLPFDGNLAIVLAQIVKDKPPSPRKLNADVPKDIEAVCLKCLEKEPGKRYGSARELADDLNSAVRGEP